jgi:hypothetical protein
MNRSNGSTKVAVIAACLALVAVLVPASSPATVYSTCGGTYTGPASSCSLTVVGVGFHLQAIGSPFTFVELTLKDRLGNRIAGCSGNVYCTTDHRLIQGTPPVGPFPSAPIFNCIVQGGAPGSYRCDSFTA